MKPRIVWNKVQSGWYVTNTGWQALLLNRYLEGAMSEWTVINPRGDTVSSIYRNCCGDYLFGTLAECKEVVANLSSY